MLGFLFRGVFLVSIMGWYSSTVWKMIDGYFKDQFDRYLKDQYQKNPIMRSDVLRASLKGASEGPGLSPDLSKLEVAVAKEDDQGKVGPEDPDGGTLGGGDDGGGGIGTSGSLEQPREFLHPERKRSRRKSRTKRIEFSPEDFQTLLARTPADQDYDFSEFVADEDEDKGRGGGEVDSREILVSRLPYRPRADIGDLERVSEEEFCPVSGKDEGSCKETQSWGWGSRR